MNKLQQVGKEIRAKRESFGADIDELAVRLKIRKRYLVAIEEGEITNILPEVYAYLSIKTYANLLQLDGEEIVTRLRAVDIITETVEEKKEKAKKLDKAPTRDYIELLRPNYYVLTISVLFILAIYGVWFKANYPARPVSTDYVTNFESVDKQPDFTNVGFASGVEVFDTKELLEFIAPVFIEDVEEIYEKDEDNLETRSKVVTTGINPTFLAPAFPEAGKESKKLDFGIIN